MSIHHAPLGARSRPASLRPPRQQVAVEKKTKVSIMSSYHPNVPSLSTDWTAPAYADAIAAQ
jgi:hypothetical protein